MWWLLFDSKGCVCVRLIYSLMYTELDAIGSAITVNMRLVCIHTHTHAELSVDFSCVQV